jgi:hypothetical protein
MKTLKAIWEALKTTVTIVGVTVWSIGLLWEFIRRFADVSFWKETLEMSVPAILIFLACVFIYKAWCKT